MASPEVLDVTSLLQPIPGDLPAGEDIRTDTSPKSLYYQIKDARSAARAAERQALAAEGETAKPDWRPVLLHGQRALAERTKDLEVAAFVIEALLRLHGFAGLRDGFRLTRGLVEQFWDGLYPTPDEEGIDTRLAPLTSLNGDDAEGTLIAPIARVPITSGSSAGPFASYHYQQAAALEALETEAREKRIEQGTIPLAQIETAVGETPAPFYIDLVDDLKQCQEEFEGLSTTLHERCGGRSPPASNIRSALTACLDTVLHLARAKLPMAMAEITDSAGSGDAVAVAGNGALAVPGAVRTREDALNMLLRVADYFRRTEPHNPVSYAVEYAVNLSRMSLPELMTELITDDSARAALFRQVGIRPPQPSG